MNASKPIDCCLAGIELGATLVARSFSGDKRQLSAILKACVAHRGLAIVDVISPCTTFNDHDGSTKSYSYMKDHEEPLQEVSFVPVFEDITVEYDPGTTVEVTMHDGSRLRLRKRGLRLRNLCPGHVHVDIARALLQLFVGSFRQIVIDSCLF